MKTTITKNYSVEVPGSKPVIIRQTTTVQHAIKHACYAAELQITVIVRDNRTKVVVLEVPAIDDAHAIRAKCKRDKRYVKRALRAVKGATR